MKYFIFMAMVSFLASANLNSLSSPLIALTDPAKLETLGERGANPRFKKILYWLYQEKNPEMALDRALEANHTPIYHRALIRDNLLRNLKLAAHYGLWTPENLEALRCGLAPTIPRGNYAGELIEINHIIPYSIAPHYGNHLANLELMPESMNRKISAHFGKRQQKLLQKLSSLEPITERKL